MVMLYQDPTGKSVGTAPSMSSASKFSVNQSSNTNADEKIMMLEKALMEKENKINELTHRIRAENVSVGYFINVRVSTSMWASLASFPGSSQAQAQFLTLGLQLCGYP